MPMPAYGEPERRLRYIMYTDHERSIGTYDGDPVVELEYPKAFQEVLLKAISPMRKFRYVYLGGGLTETNQEKTLWLFSGGRRGRV